MSTKNSKTTKIESDSSSSGEKKPTKKSTDKLITYVKPNIDNNNIKFVIDVSDPDKLNDLFKYVYTTTCLFHILFNGVPYYPYTTLMSPGPLIRPDHDPDFECDSHFDRCKVSSSIYPKLTDKIEYIVCHDPANDIHHRSYTYPKIISKIRRLSTKKILLNGYEKMTVYNVNGFHTGHFGSNHCKVHLDFHRNIEIDVPITLETFVEICYKIKSHKFSHRCESFSKTEIYVSNLGELEVDVEFDHTS